MAGQKLGINDLTFVVDQSLHNDSPLRRFRYTSTGLLERDKNHKPTLQEIEVEWWRLATKYDRFRFQLGDLAELTARYYGPEAYERLLAMTGLDGLASMVEDWAYTCRNVPHANRLDGLSFSHHRVVAPVDDRDEQRELLRYAEAKGLSVGQFRQHVKKYFGAEAPDEPPPGNYSDRMFALEQELHQNEIKLQEERQQRILAEQQAAQYQSALDRVHAPDVARGQLVIIKERLRGLLSSVNMVELVMHPDQEWQRIKREMESILLDLEELDK